MDEKNPDQPLAPGHDPVRGRAYWRANLKLIAVLLSIWFLVSVVGGILFVEQLNQFKIGQLPFGFWLAQQGSIIVFVILIFVYMIGMDRLDKKFGMNEAE